MTESAPDPRPSRRRILLVEDDEAVRRTFQLILQEAGFHVDQAESGQAALSYLDEHGCPDLLLSDLVLPAPNGEELARICRERCPDTILVLMSGYSEEELHELDIRQVVFIPKPIGADQLRETMARLLR